MAISPGFALIDCYMADGILGRAFGTAPCGCGRKREGLRILYSLCPGHGATGPFNVAHEVGYPATPWNAADVVSRFLQGIHFGEYC